MVLEDISALLVADGGFVDGTNIFRHGLQPNPARQIGLNQSGGVQPHGNVAGTQAKAVEQPTVQVLCRDQKSTDAADLANDVFKLLQDVNGRTLNSVVYYSIGTMQSPQFLQRDAQGREVFVFNVQIRKAFS